MSSIIGPPAKKAYFDAFYNLVHQGLSTKDREACHLSTRIMCALIHSFIGWRPTTTLQESESSEEESFDDNDSVFFEPGEHGSDGECTPYECKCAYGRMIH